jgi:hypothetical protein
MPNSSSKTAEKINDQYFTPVSTAEWCLHQLLDLGWSLDGVALEPCVGVGSFVQASENAKIPLKWVTNDLFPQPGVKVDHQVDLRQLTIDPRPDFVITNPPFGKSNSLARHGLAHFLRSCDKVAMVLPRGARRMGFKDAQPLNAHLVLDVDLPSEEFQLPDGQVKEVRTCFQAWEVREEKRQKIRDTLDLRRDLFDFIDAAKEDGTFGTQFQVCRWGVMNKVRDEIKVSGSWLSVKGVNGFDPETLKQLISKVDVSEYEDLSTSVPAFDVPIWHHRLNRAAVESGYQK